MASAASSTADDLTIAQVLQAVETLISVFQFEPEVAQQAVEAVGTDVTKCYNFILDNDLAHDKGGPIVPIDNCPHIQAHVCISVDQLPSPRYATCSYVSAGATGGLKGAVAEDGVSCPAKENWVCFECGVVRCSRYANGHGKEHYEGTIGQGPDKAGHCVAASLSDLSVWCYQCNAYLKDSRVEALVKKLEELKFGDDGNDSQKEDGKDGEDDVGEKQGDENNMKDDTEGHDDSMHDGKESAAQEKDEEGEVGDDDDEEESDDNEDEDHGGGGDKGNGIAGGIESVLPVGIPQIFRELFDSTEEEIDYPFESCPDSLADVAKFIQSDKCRSIVILAGAGMSVASGIPDFRSAGGLYDTLRPELLTASEVEREAMRMDPTVALEKGMFLQNPLPCLELNRPFILGIRDQIWRATLAHRFVELLHKKTGKLTRLYQQNIDGLEGQCSDLPREKVIYVHGSMDEAECLLCGTKSDFGEFCKVLETNIKDLTGKDPNAPAESKGIACGLCGYEAMKPSIVLFRSPLPKEFFEKVPDDLPGVDLLIVVGTSLAVAPANTLVFRVPKSAMRLVVNREPVGFRLGIDYSEEAKRDYFARGDIDNVLLDLMMLLDWYEDLKPLVDLLPEASAKVLRERIKEEEAQKEAT